MNDVNITIMGLCDECMLKQRQMPVPFPNTNVALPVQQRMTHQTPRSMTKIATALYLPYLAATRDLTDIIKFCKKEAEEHIQRKLTSILQVATQKSDQCLRLIKL